MILGSSSSLWHCSGPFFAYWADLKQRERIKLSFSNAMSKVLNNQRNSGGLKSTASQHKLEVLPPDLYQLTFIIATELERILLLGYKSVQNILYPRRPFSQSHLTLFALRYRDPAAATLCNLLNHDVAYVARRVWYNAVLIESFLCALDDACGMPRWVYRCCADAFSARIS